MKQRQTKKPYTVVLEYPNGVTRIVKVLASTREVAERRALKRNPAAVRVSRGDIGVKYE